MRRTLQIKAALGTDPLLICSVLLIHRQGYARPQIALKHVTHRSSLCASVFFSGKPSSAISAASA